MGSFRASAIRSLGLGEGGTWGGPGVKRPRDRRTLRSLTEKKNNNRYYKKDRFQSRGDNDDDNNSNLGFILIAMECQGITLRSSLVHLHI